MSMPLPASLYLQSVIVAQNFRGLGVGNQLLEQSIVLAEAFGHSRLSLHVWADNATAIKLYNKAGFSKIKAINIPSESAMGHIGGKWIMEKLL